MGDRGSRDPAPRRWRGPMALALTVAAVGVGTAILVEGQHRAERRAESAALANAALVRLQLQLESDLRAVQHLAYRIAEANGLSTELRLALFSRDARHQIESLPALVEVAVLGADRVPVLREPTPPPPVVLDRAALEALLERAEERGEATLGLVPRLDDSRVAWLIVTPFRFDDGSLGATVARFDLGVAIEAMAGPGLGLHLVEGEGNTELRTQAFSSAERRSFVLAGAPITAFAVPTAGPDPHVGLLSWVIGVAALMLAVFVGLASHFAGEASRRADAAAQSHVLRAALERAEGATRAKSDFLAAMSHEIRTPLHGIMGMAGLLSRSELGSEQQDHLRMITQSAEALLLIVGDILDFSKIESGRLELEPLPIDLRAVSEDAVALVSPEARRKHLDLSMRWSPGAPHRVIGDAGRIRQVLLNLLSNALKFTERGEVAMEVSAKVVEGHRVLLAFQVRDSGIGIAPEVQGKLFEKFTQADLSTTRRFGGTGLGLAISRALVEAMGGKIWVESELDQGSTFHFTLSLPLDRAAPAEPQHPGRSALVALANPRHRTHLAERLRGLSLEVQEVRTLEELQSAAPALSGFDFVFLDQSWEQAAPPIPPPTRPVRVGELDLLRVVPDGAEGWVAELALPLRQRDLHRLLAPAPASPPGSVALPVAEPIRARVLVVEDNPVNQLVARRTLERLGHQVDLAKDGKEAIARVKATAYSLILMDCHMPEMDGYSATRAIREFAPELPIIAFTASATAQEAALCRAAGMDDYLTKPARADELTQMITRHLGPGAKGRGVTTEADFSSRTNAGSRSARP